MKFGKECQRCGTILMDFDVFNCTKCGNILCASCMTKHKYVCSECEEIVETVNHLEFISSTMFEAFHKCPHKFYHDFIAKTIEDADKQNKYSATGSALHKLFEDYVYEGDKLDDMRAQLKTEYVQAFKQIPEELFDNEDDRANFLERDLRIVESWINQQITNPKPCLFTEAQHFISLHESLPTVRVTIDRINGHEGCVEEWEVEDYKTGKIYTAAMLKDNYQLGIYAMAIAKLYGQYPRMLTLNFVQHNQSRTFFYQNNGTYMCKVPRGGTYIIDLQERLNSMIEIAKQIREGYFPPKQPSEHFCQNFCYYGANQICGGLETSWAMELKRRG